MRQEDTGEALFSATSFDHVGRSYQLRINDAQDLDRVLALDRTHWVAVSAPIDSFQLDPAFLGYIDRPGNGRVTCDEVRDAIRWLKDVLVDLSGVSEQASVLSCSAIRTTGEGGDILRTAQGVLRELEVDDPSQVSLEQVRKILRAREKRPVSEAGVVLPSATGGLLGDLLAEIVRVTGGTAHPSGSAGVTEARFCAFLEDARAWLAWRAEGDLGDAERTSIMPFGDATAKAYGAFTFLEKKIDQFFAQCDAVDFSPEAAPLLRVAAEDWKTSGLTDPSAIREVMRAAPLAVPTATHVLTRGEAVNPYYREALDTLFDKVLAPELGEAAEDGLSPAEWEQVRAVFAPYRAWLGRRKGDVVAALGNETLGKMLAPEVAQSFSQLVASSRETAVLLDSVRQLEKLVLFQANMLLFLNNFVSFPHLYDMSTRALFEMGSLIMDGRRLEFAVRVTHVAGHATLAKASLICVLYVEITPTGAPAYTVAVPVTSGGKGNLGIGKRGVFMDVAGKVHDARVVQIIENPISIGEAILSPFQRIGKLLTGKIEQMTTAAEKKLDTTTTTTFDQVATATSPQKNGESQQTKGNAVGGMLMGGGVALAALSSAAAYITSVFSTVGPWKVTAGLLVAVLAVVMPASVISILKLRKRDLSALLEGCGWAINVRMRLTFAQGHHFTHSPPRPGMPVGMRPRTLGLIGALVALVIIKIIIG